MCSLNLLCLHTQSPLHGHSISYAYILNLLCMHTQSFIHSYSIYHTTIHACTPILSSMLIQSPINTTLDSIFLCNMHSHLPRHNNCICSCVLYLSYTQTQYSIPHVCIYSFPRSDISLTEQDMKIELDFSFSMFLEPSSSFLLQFGQSSIHNFLCMPNLPCKSSMHTQIECVLQTQSSI
jgi:hypothetical protein